MERKQKVMKRKQKVAKRTKSEIYQFQQIVMKQIQKVMKWKQKVTKRNKKRRNGTKGSEMGVAIWQHEHKVMKRNKK